MNSTDAILFISNATANDDNARYAMRSIMLCTNERDTPMTLDDDALPAALADDDCDDDTAAALADAYRTLLADPYARESLTHLALDYSLCPLHFLDYAICFDDDDADCRSIRTIHPSHDT